MANIPLLPIMGINNVKPADELQGFGDSAHLFVRKAENLNISKNGKVSLRQGLIERTATPFKDIWQSPLHKDVFARLGDKWVLVNADTWEHTELATVGYGSLSHCVVNNLVYVSGDAGIFQYDGSKAEKVTIEEAPSPLVITDLISGSVSGKVMLAISFLRDDKEGPVSEVISIEPTQSFSVIPPVTLDQSLTAFNLYASTPSGSELYLIDTIPLSDGRRDYAAIPASKAVAKFRHLSPMPSGKNLCLWRGRLITTHKNLIRFSEPLAFHLHNKAEGFYQMPQRITFLAAVSGGLWIGQNDGVVFLRGSDPDDFALETKALAAPVPNSLVMVDAEQVSAEISQGERCALWLSENGFVIGTASGQAIEIHAKALKGITGQRATSVVLDGRAYCALE